APTCTHTCTRTHTHTYTITHTLTHARAHRLTHPRARAQSGLLPGGGCLHGAPAASAPLQSRRATAALPPRQRLESQACRSDVCGWHRPPVRRRSRHG